MSDDLDLRGIDQRHEPDPQFRAALQHRLAAIVGSTHPASSTEMPDVAVFDLETTIAKPEPSRNASRVVLVILAAAAAIVAAILVATRDDAATPADQPSPTVPPRALPNTPGSQTPFAPGTYFIDEVDGTPTPRIFVTLRAGWTDMSPDAGWAIAKRGVEEGVGFMFFGRADRVYSDACHPNDVFYPWSVATVDGLVDALTKQRGGWVDVTAPTDISVDGYVGKAFQRTAPSKMSSCERSFGGTRTSNGPVPHADFRSWEDSAGGPGPYEPGEIETLWVLDIKGTIVIIDTRLWPGPSATAHTDFADAELDSLRIARG